MKYDLTYIQPDLTPAELDLWNLGLRPCYEGNNPKPLFWSQYDDNWRRVHKRYPSQDVDVARWEEENWPR